MNPQLYRRLRLHLVWLLLTLFGAFVCCGFYWLMGRREAPGGGTVAGYLLGLFGLGLIVFTSCYAIRRRLGPNRLRKTIGKSDPEREKRLAMLNETIADLQVAGKKRGDAAADLRKAALSAVKNAGFQGQIQVEVFEGDAGGPLLRLIPREHPGRLENWLMAHQYLGGLLILVVLLHAGFQFRGIVALIATILTFAVAVSGMIAGLLYVFVPRWLLRMEGSEPPGPKGRGMGAVVLNGLLPVWLYVHMALTGALLSALIVHVVSTFYY